MTDLAVLAIGLGVLPLSAILLYSLRRFVLTRREVVWGFLAGVLAFLALGHAMAAVLVNKSLFGDPAIAIAVAFVGLAVSGDEPTSGDFNVAGNIVGRASLPAFHPGNWTYRCGMHPTTMTGTIRIHEQPRPVNLTLIGDAALGWGFSNATLREPGPALVVLWGTKLTLTLIAHDSAPHNWFIDYNNDVIASPGEPASPDFKSPVGTIVVWPFIADQTGNWTYRCHIHPTSMTGTISIVGGPPPELRSGALPLITGIMIGALAVVLVFAVIYHVRAVRAAKRTR